MIHKNKKNQAILLCLVCTFFWGAGYPVLKLSYSHWAIASSNVPSKLLFAGIRFTISGMLLFLITSIIQKKICFPEKKKLPRIVTLGIFQTSLQYSLLYIGLANTTGTKGSVLNQISVFLTVLLTPVFFKSEKITYRKIIGCIIGFAGIVVMNFAGLSFSAEFGDLIVIISSCCAATGYLLSKSMPSNSNPMLSTAFQQLFGGVVVLIIGLISGGKLTQVTLAGMGSLGFLVLVAAVAYSIWFYLLQHYEITKISIYKFITPIFGVLLSGLLLGETIVTVPNILALLFVCTGIIVVNGERKTQST